MGKFTDLTTLVQNFPPKTGEEVYKDAYTIGEDIGTLVRVITGYGEENKTKRRFWATIKQL